jgi:hypothetical protein
MAPAGPVSPEHAARKAEAAIVAMSFLIPISL